MFAEEISYYKLIKKLGSGGMGEVYLAEDTRLNRKVALKILSSNLSTDRKHLSRFLQEARLAANLNHPNICVIYEVNESDETPFIAMEYIEGETLAHKIQSGSLDLEQTTEIAVQIADALDEAHHQGIIHRDIKSANIILNRRGFVKILDFGLAKSIIEEVSEEAVTQAKTEAGVLVGTVQYMSPEHAMGKALDGRTDLWSVGVLLYEMVTGETPFKGQTQVGIFDEILHKNPVSPSEINEKVSPDFEKIILKLLEKDREFRYQTASDLRADLRRLQRYSDEKIRFESREANSASETATPPTGFVETKTGENNVQNTEATQVSKSSKFNWNYRLTSLLIIGIIGLIGYGMFLGRGMFSQYLESFNPPKQNNSQFSESKRVTNLGNIEDATISPDGKYLAYVQDEGISKSLWVKQLATGSIFQVIQSANVVFQGIAISPDSSWIYYNVWDKKSVGEVFRVPVLGGIPQLVIHDVMPGVEISPDNSKIAFVRSYDKEKENRLIVANVDGTNENIITKRGRDEGFIGLFCWSPDGKSLGILASTQQANGTQITALSEISLEEKRENTIWTVPDKLQNFSGGLIWQSDKKEFLMTIAERQSPFFQIWQISYPDGNARQLTKDFNTYRRLSLTSDGKTLMTIQQDFFANIWTVSANNPTQAEKITTGKLEGLGVRWTPDGKIIFQSGISGNIDIWMADADGSNKKQLTSDVNYDLDPCVTFDGKKVAFISNRGENNWNIWTMNLDGSNQKQLMKTGAQWGLFCSKIENSLYFSGSMEQKNGIWKMSIDTGELKFIEGNQTFRVNISPDEKYLAYSFWDEENKKMAQEIYTIETGEKKRFELPISAIGEGQIEPSVKWTPDGRNLSFINAEKDVNNIWIQPLKGGKPTKMTDFKEYSIFNYDWSADGKKIVLTRGKVNNDVVLITREK